jgi:predicted AlkP superfamily phosphohydrolase/phosphomutase/tetratricopeptide (TPR) repeat protein
MKRKTVLIGWDSADWNVINPLLKQGKLPALKTLMGRGISGKIRTLDPPLSPMLWTSIATGVRADKHGILGFVEPSPNGENIRPVSSTSRKVKAIWNILNQNGKRSNVVGWWPSYPVEPINGIMVSDRFLAPEIVHPEKELSKDGMIHPADLYKTFNEFKVATGDITGDMLFPFLPNIEHDEHLKEHNILTQVRKNIAHASNVHAAFTYALQESEWDFAAVYYEALDMFCHIGMKFAPPYRDAVKRKNYDDFKEIVESAYRFHDLMLGRLLDIIDPETNIILLSDHGFHSGLQRPLYIPNEPAGIAIEHAPFGVLVMAGPDINNDGHISGASVLDITPTLLHLMGLPVGKDMEGKVLEATIKNIQPIQWVDSWENIEGDSGQHDAKLREDPILAQEAIQQLVELGYIDAPEENIQVRVKETIWENLYYKARNMVDGLRTNEAIEIFEKIFEESNYLRYGYRLAQILILQKRFLKSKQLIDKLKILKKEEDKKTKERIIAHHKKTGTELKYKSPNYVDVLEGLYFYATGNLTEAAKMLKKAQAENPNNLEIAYKIGLIGLDKKQYKAAKSQFLRILSMDDRIAIAHFGLGLTFLKMKDEAEAINEFLLAIESDFYQTSYHYHLGETLKKVGYIEEAISAFKVCVHLNNAHLPAHNQLYKLYKEQNDDALAQNHLNIIQQYKTRKQTIVTGLTGTHFEELFETLKNSGIPCEFNRIYVPETKLYRIDLNFDQNQPLMYVPANMLNQLPVDVQYELIIFEADRQQILNYWIDKQIDTTTFSELALNEKIQEEERLIDDFVSQNNLLGLLKLDQIELNNVKQKQELLKFMKKAD